MARRKTQRKKRKPGARFSQSVLLLLTGSALTLCVLSITYGFLVRRSMAEHDVRGFRIEVLNGTEVGGLASRSAAVLRRKGIDVLEVGNADHLYLESILIARKDNNNLDLLAETVGCTHVIEQRVKDSMVDATLILGADFRRLKLAVDDDSALSE